MHVARAPVFARVQPLAHAHNCLAGSQGGHRLLLEAEGGATYRALALKVPVPRASRGDRASCAARQRGSGMPAVPTCQQFEHLVPAHVPAPLAGGPRRADLHQVLYREM